MKRRDKKELRTYDCGNGHTHASKYAAKNCAACASIETARGIKYKPGSAAQALKAGE